MVQAPQSLLTVTSWGRTAGRAAEELVYGPAEMSTLNQRRIAMAREIATKMVVASAMSDTPMLVGRPMAHTVRMGSVLHHVVPPRVSQLFAIAPCTTMRPPSSLHTSHITRTTIIGLGCSFLHTVRTSVGRDFLPSVSLVLLTVHVVVADMGCACAHGR